MLATSDAGHVIAGAGLLAFLTLVASGVLFALVLLSLLAAAILVWWAAPGAERTEWRGPGVAFGFVPLLLGLFIAAEGGVLAGLVGAGVSLAGFTATLGLYRRGLANIHVHIRYGWHYLEELFPSRGPGAVLQGAFTALCVALVLSTLSAFFLELLPMLFLVAGVLIWFATPGTERAQLWERRSLESLAFGLLPLLLGAVITPASNHFTTKALFAVAALAGLAVTLALYQEGLFNLYFHLTYLFDHGRVEAAMDKHRQAKDFEDKFRDLDRQEQALRAQLGPEQEAAEMPRRMEAVPEDVETYHGLLEEAGRRFRERQLKKTIQVTRERVGETAGLYQAMANVQRQKAELVKAYHAFKTVHQDIEIADLEREVKKTALLAERERLQLQQAAFQTEREALRPPPGAPRGTLPQAGLVLGRGEDHEGMPRKIVLTEALRDRHLYLLGMTRTGKSTLIQNLVLQDLAQGRGLCFIDPHGDNVRQLLQRVPQARIGDVVYFDATDGDCPPAFNVLATTGPREHLVGDVLSVFHRLFPESWGPRMEHILRYGLLTLLKSPLTHTLADLRPLLLQPVYRGAILTGVRDAEVRSFWADEYPKLPKDSAAPIVNKLSALLMPGGKLRAILTQRENKIDPGAIMNGGKALLVNLAKGQVGEEASRLLGALLVSAIQLEALRRADMPEKERRPFSLYVDEFQNYTVSSFGTILSEAAKYKLSLALAHQYLDQVPREIQAAIFGNVGTIVSFRVGVDDARLLQKEMRKPIIVERQVGRRIEEEEVFWPSLEDLTNLPTHQAFVRLGRADQVERLKTLPLPPVPPGGEAAAAEIRRLARERYGGVVEEEPSVAQRGTEASATSAPTGQQEEAEWV
jgi:hypothetical protein